MSTARTLVETWITTELTGSNSPNIYREHPFEFVKRSAEKLIKELEAGFAALSSKLTTAQGSLATAQSNVASLTAQLAAANTQIASLQAQVTALAPAQGAS